MPTSWADDDGEDDVADITTGIAGLSKPEGDGKSDATKTGNSLSSRIRDASPEASAEKSENKAASSEASVTESSIDSKDNLVANKNTVSVKLADIQADPNSPLYSAHSFEELNL